MHCDECAGDAGRARAAVGLNHVAIDLHGALAERVEIDDRAQRAADQALDFLRASRLLAARRFAVGARVGCTRQHAVFSGQPALPFALQKWRHFVLDADGAQDLGVAGLDQHRALGMARVAACNPDIA